MVSYDDIVRMARIAGVRDDGQRFEFSEYKYLERFAALVAAAEREACARVAERSESAEHCAAAIRARSQP